MGTVLIDVRLAFDTITVHVNISVLGRSMEIFHIIDFRDMFGHDTKRLCCKGSVLHATSGFVCCWCFCVMVVLCCAFMCCMMCCGVYVVVLYYAQRTCTTNECTLLLFAFHKLFL